MALSIFSLAMAFHTLYQFEHASSNKDFPRFRFVTQRSIDACICAKSGKNINFVTHKKIIRYTLTFLDPLS